MFTVTGSLDIAHRPAVREGMVAITDLAWFGVGGISGAIFGPGSIGNAHGNDESIAIPEVTEGRAAFAVATCLWYGLADGA